MRTARMLGLCLIALTMSMSACHRGQGPLTPVSGTVAYKKYLLQGGTIVFTPDVSRGGNGPMALGKINQDGTYHLYTAQTLGAPAGWYRVTVTSLAPSGMQIPSQPINTPYSYLPAKYRDPELSELACEIKPNKVNSINFNLD